MTPDSDSSSKTVYVASWTGLDARILVKNDEKSVKFIKQQNIFINLNLGLITLGQTNYKTLENKNNEEKLRKHEYPD